MRRKWLLVTIGGVLLGLLTLMYSLMGAMTGVYVYDGAQFGMNGHGYVIRRGDAWYDVYYSSPRHALPDATKLETEHVDIRPGIWAMTLIVRKSGAEIPAYATWSPVAVYRFTFGDYRNLGR